MSSTFTNSSRFTWLIDSLFLAAIVLAFYALWLGSYPLFTPDEGRYSEVAREMIANHDYITPRVNGVAFLDKPILHYWLQAIAIHWFGVKEWALRFFPLLFGIVGCLLTYCSGRYLFDRRSGLLSALILATAPLYFCAAHYANLDLEVAILISGTLFSLLLAIRSEQHIRHLFCLAAYCFAALAFLTKGLIAIAFPAMIVGLWILLLNRFDLLKKMYLIAGILLFALIVCPWYILVQKANPAFLHYFFITQQVTRFLSSGEFNNKTIVWFYLPIVLLGFFPWTIFLLQAMQQSLSNVWRERQQHPTELFLLLWIAVIFVFFSIPHSKIMGYILPIFPALALIVGHYLSRQWEKKTFGLGLFFFILLGTLLASALLALPHYQWLDLAPAFFPYLITIAIILLSSVIVALGCLKIKNLRWLVLLCLLCSVAMLLTLTRGAFYLNDNSAKPLVTVLQKIIKPQDEVVTYFKYYQDVPLYLGRRVTIVNNWQSPDIPLNDNWMREFWYGMPFQQTDAWLISEKKFWTRWQSDKRVFVLLNVNYFQQFSARAKKYFYLGSTNNILLLSNQA